MSVNFLVSELGAAGTWEQPAGSYMFPYLEQQDLLTAPSDKVVLLHLCRFGRPRKKPTTFTCFGGLRLRALDKRCTPSSPCSRKTMCLWVLGVQLQHQQPPILLHCARLMQQTSLHLFRPRLVNLPLVAHQLT